jgi:predicted RNA methylase
MLIDADVMKTLACAVTEANTVALVGKLDRKLYERTNKVLEAIGGKWDRKRKAHVFEQDAFELLEPIILTGEYSRTKQDFGQFDTPKALATEVVNSAEIVPGMQALEPSAGIGNIAVALCEAGANVMAFEIDPKRCSKLVAAVQPMRGFNMVVERDFLAFGPEPVYDRVVMNPPFGKQADIEHVTHAWQFVKPGGVLVAIMSAGAGFSTTKRAVAFRALVERNGGHFRDLPAGSFRESGTNVNTVILTMRRPAR